MPATRYDRCRKLLEVYLKSIGDQISMTVLRRLIIRKIGADEYRVVRSSIKMMMEVGLIKDCGNYFEINKKEVKD